MYWLLTLPEAGQVGRVDAVVGSEQLGDGHHEATGDSYAVHQDERERAGGGGIHRDAGVHEQASHPDPPATQSSGWPAYFSRPQLVWVVEAAWLVHILSCPVARAFLLVQRDFSCWARGYFSRGPFSKRQV